MVSISPPCTVVCRAASLSFISQIVFEKRKEDDILNDCLMSVDGTDYRIYQKGSRFASHKYAGKSALRYELGICIRTGRLVWIQGPYPAGEWNDIAIFTDCLAHFLDPDERVEADCGYVGHADLIKCPNNPSNPQENLAMQGRVRSRHETFNGRLKTWEILKQVFRHDISRHSSVLHACCVISELMVENGEPLFAVQYSD